MIQIKQDAWHYLFLDFIGSYPSDTHQFVFQVRFQVDSFSIGGSPGHENIRVAINDDVVGDFIKGLKEIDTSWTGQALFYSDDDGFNLEITPFNKFGYLLIKVILKYPANNVAIDHIEPSFVNQFQGFLYVEQGNLRDWLNELEKIRTKKPSRIKP